MVNPFTHQQQPAHSPPGIALPPAKRPRVSPGPSSPQLNSASIHNALHIATSPSSSSFHSPYPYSSSPPPGAMGPPPRPTMAQQHDRATKEDKEKEKEKITDINDINDAIFGSGVDLREEENYLANTLRNVHTQRRYADTASSVSSAIADALSPQRLGATGELAFGGSGPISHAALSSDSFGDEVDRKHRAAATTLAKQRESHLRDPFLSGNTLRHHMHKIALDQGITLDTRGLYEPSSEAQQPRTEPSSPIVPSPTKSMHGVSIVGSDGEGVMSVQTTPHAYLEETSRYADLLSLLSIAANQQIRVLLDEAYVLARGRRYGSHGIVPSDLQHLAPGSDTQLLSTSWDLPMENAKKDTSTVAFASPLTKHLQKLALADRDAEVARLRKREERAKQVAARAAAGPSDTSNAATPAPSGASTPMPGTPGTPGRAPMTIEKPMTKKEKERQAKAGMSEDVLHKNANVTAAMALGFGKKKTKKYNWMTGAAAATPANLFARPTASTSAGTTTLAKHESGRVKTEPGLSTSRGLAGPLQAQERRWGDWREDGIKGRGIQLRDWAAVLERNGREKKALERCLLDMDRAADGSALR